MLSGLSLTERVDVLNIGLMILSCWVAVIIPFELFLFSYAVLGPLHYLTEISWLHDNKYYANKGYDAIVLSFLAVVIAVLGIMTLVAKMDVAVISAMVFYVAFFAALLFILVKDNKFRLIGLAFILLTSSLANKYFVFFVVLLPTLVHVFLFTAFFMLFGTIKSKSRTGIAALVALFLCAWFLLDLYAVPANYHASDYVRKNYDLFKAMNTTWLFHFNGVFPNSPSFNWDHEVYETTNGILIMRFIAFAYTYHYLNWFSKTNIIKWNKIPKVRMILIVAIWLLSIALYWKDYKLGLCWLLVLSYMHVLLEFPLNFRSMLLLVGYKSTK